LEPIQWIREFAKRNPQSATLLFGGVACFAAVAAVGSMGLDLESKILPALYVIGIGIVLVIATAIINNRFMLNTVSWFIIVMTAMWMIMFIISRFSANPVWACAAYFWTPCRTTADEVATAQSVSRPASPVQSPAKSAAPGSIQPGNYKVLVQFAGVLQREDVRAMMKKLREFGWNVLGVDGGGQRTGAAAGYGEIRYRNNVDASAAQELAQLIQSTKIVSKTISIKQNSTIEAGTLEVWISQ
jgi:hypothetical protein